MKTFMYAALIAGLVPIQSILLPHLSLWNVKPDVGLIAVCLVGLFGGELEGLLIGLAMGWVMSLFSAGDLASSMVTKGVAGYLAGLAGRQVAHMTPVVLLMGLLVTSCLAGLVTAVSLKPNDQQDLWWAVQSVVLPQACFDAAVGGVLYWLASNRVDVERWVSEYRA
jgi:LytS/YehU family sensor histidine kinase